MMDDCESGSGTQQPLPSQALLLCPVLRPTNYYVTQGSAITLTHFIPIQFFHNNNCITNDSNNYGDNYCAYKNNDYDAYTNNDN
jgi:hypothetical protein